MCLASKWMEKYTEGAVVTVGEGRARLPCSGRTVIVLRAQESRDGGERWASSALVGCKIGAVSLGGLLLS